MMNELQGNMGLPIKLDDYLCAEDNEYPATQR